MPTQHKPDPIMLLREAVAAILCRDFDDPVVKSIAVAFCHSADKCEIVLTTTGYGNANIYFADGEYENSSVGLTYPRPRRVSE